MAEQSTIKEFLVALGFQVDEKGLKKFASGIGEATKRVTGLVAAINGAALTVSAGVTAFAATLESLYFASQRTGASVANLKAAQRASEDLGSSAAEAQAAIESISKKLRENPAYEGFIATLGVQTRKANGELEDAEELLFRIGQQLRKRDSMTQIQYANDLGIGDRQLLAITSDDYAEKRAREQRKRQQAGLDETAKASHELMNEVRDLRDQFQLAAIQIEASLIKRVLPSMQQFAAWFEKNSPMIVERTSSILKMFLELADRVGPSLTDLLDYLIKLDKATDGWSTRVIALTAAFVALGGPAVVGGVLALATALLKVGAAATGAKAATTAATAAAGNGGKSLLGRLFGGLLGRAAGAIGLLTYSKGLNEGEDAEVAKLKAAQQEELRKRAAATAPAMFADLEKRYGLPAGLLDSMWLQESARGTKMLSPAGAKGHFQFMPKTAREYGIEGKENDLGASANAAARYMQWLLKQTGGDVSKALAAYNGGIGNLQKRGLSGMPGESQNYFRQILGRLPQSSPTQVSQKVDITINSRDNAQDIGEAAGRSVKQANEELARDLQGMTG